MRKRYRVTLTAEEREALGHMISRGKAAARRLVHARVLLQADASEGGPDWTDTRIAEAVRVSVRTIGRVRQRFVEDGLEAALRPKPSPRVYARKLDGAQEAKLLALACSGPPEGRRRWTLRLLAERMVELEIVPELSHETVRQTLKKERNCALDKVRLGPYCRRDDTETGRYADPQQSLSPYRRSGPRNAGTHPVAEGPVCPHCGAVENVTRLQGKAHRPGVFQCNNCHGQFTVTVGTIFENSHIPLRKWLMAFALLCSAKKGISALQLQRELDLGSYRTAWHLAHRIRHAMSQEPLAGLLKGTVEVDETYVGGKPRPEPGQPRNAKRGRGTKKTPVVALVERDGRVRARKVDRVDGKTLKGAIRENVDRKARIMTDELSVYRGIGTEFAGGHETSITVPASMLAAMHIRTRPKAISPC